MTCSVCGAPVVYVNVNGKKIPLDKYTVQDRYVEISENKWVRGRAGVSHFKTCQQKMRFRIGN